MIMIVIIIYIYNHNNNNNDNNNNDNDNKDIDHYFTNNNNYDNDYDNDNNVTWSIRIFLAIVFRSVKYIKIKKWQKALTVIKHEYSVGRAPLFKNPDHDPDEL